MIAFGLGTLRLSPDAFWAMSLPELRAAARGMRGEFSATDPLGRQALAALIRQFPDEPAGTQKRMTEHGD